MDPSETELQYPDGESCIYAVGMRRAQVPWFRVSGPLTFRSLYEQITAQHKNKRQGLGWVKLC